MLASWPVFVVCTDIDPLEDAVPLFLGFAFHVQCPFGALNWKLNVLQSNSTYFADSLCPIQTDNRGRLAGCEKKGIIGKLCHYSRNRATINQWISDNALWLTEKACRYFFWHSMRRSKKSIFLATRHDWIGFLNVLSRTARRLFTCYACPIKQCFTTFLLFNATPSSIRNVVWAAVLELAIRRATMWRTRARNDRIDIIQRTWIRGKAKKVCNRLSCQCILRPRAALFLNSWIFC